MAPVRWYQGRSIRSAGSVAALQMRRETFPPGCRVATRATARTMTASKGHHDDGSEAHERPSPEGADVGDGARRRRHEDRRGVGGVGDLDVDGVEPGVETPGLDDDHGDEPHRHRADAGHDGGEELAHRPHARHHGDGGQEDEPGNDRQAARRRRARARSRPPPRGRGRAGPGGPGRSGGRPERRRRCRSRRWSRRTTTPGPRPRGAPAATPTQRPPSAVPATQVRPAAPADASAATRTRLWTGLRPVTTWTA